MTGRERVCFALDVPSADRARELARVLAGEVGCLKVGLELFVAAGPGLVRELVALGHRVFLDLKFHDIPATVAGACRAAGGLGPAIVNLHALAGPAALARAAAAVKGGAAEVGAAPPQVIAVTVLTSHGPEELAALGLAGPPADAVLRLADLARDAGLDGVVASALEARAIRERWPSALIVTPGIRPAGAAAGDQARVLTPARAVAAGADLLVVGRPIRDAADPVAAARAIAAELDGAGCPPLRRCARPAGRRG